MKKVFFIASVITMSIIAACGSKTGGPQGIPDDPGYLLYDDNCDLCHGELGNKGLSDAADLQVSTMTEEEIREIVANGKNKMAGFSEDLTPEQIEQVATYTLTLRTQ